MSKKESLKEKVASALSLPGEVILDLPFVSMMGKNEVSVENYRNIVEFTDERIRINTSSGVLVINGRKLYIKRITSENILISGAIGNVGLGG
ncbi:MAG: sporulation protein YqfC [Firmicutes bacterium]|nr:sporulation protein YqfC [Bacillota bacterium]